MGTHSNFTSAFKSLYRKLEKTQKQLPSLIANEGTKFFVGSFDKEGFTDVSLSKWKTPLRKIPGTSEFKYPKKRDLGRRTRKILVKTGRFRRATNNSVIERTFKRVVWRINPSEVPYAARHNYGLHGMPERKVIGESKTLNRIFKRTIIQTYKKQLNNG